MEFTPHDALRYEELKKEASSDVLGFRAAARRSTNNYLRSMRGLVDRTNTNDTPAYLLLSEWAGKILPEVEALQAARQASPLRTTLAKQLRLSDPVASDLANRLVDERTAEILDSFLTIRYGLSGRARKAAHILLTLPSEEILEINNSFVSYELHKQVANELGITFYDPYSPLVKRFYQKKVEKRQIRRYVKQRAKRLKAILSRQQDLKTQNFALISRILLLELDTVLALDAHRQYQKQLDKLKPQSLTPAKKLSVFASTTKKIREAHTNKQSTTDKLVDLQAALRAIDEVLVELFDMTDSQRNSLMTRLKEYRDLEREAHRITKEQSTHAN